MDNAYLTEIAFNFALALSSSKFLQTTTTNFYGVLFPYSITLLSKSEMRFNYDTVALFY